VRVCFGVSIRICIFAVAAWVLKHAHTPSHAGGRQGGRQATARRPAGECALKSDSKNTYAAQAIGATTPLFTAIMSFVALGQREGRRVYVALIPVVAGVIMATGASQAVLTLSSCSCSCSAT